MKTESEITNYLNEIKQDERLYYKSANIQINAPLALVQLMLETQVNTLENVLGLPLSTFPLTK